MYDTWHVPAPPGAVEAPDWLAAAAAAADWPAVSTGRWLGPPPRSPDQTGRRDTKYLLIKVSNMCLGAASSTASNTRLPACDRTSWSICHPMGDRQVNKSIN
eukprot:1178225-Prorocentrum_minimum.AAC.4